MKKAKKHKGISKLSFDFNAAAKQAAKEHPKLKNTLFIDAAKDKWPQTADILAEMDVDEDDIRELGKTVSDARRLKTSFHQVIERGKKKALGAVVFHQDRHPLYGSAPGPADDAGTFDHETGHALSPEASGTPAENMADAYASLRHLQRFDGDTADLDYCAWKRAMVFMQTGATSHLTTFTVDKIIIDQKTADFLSLSPKETAAIAKDYARLNTPDEKKIQKLQKDFKPLKKLPPRQAFRKLARITLKAEPDSPTFYLGARILAGALKKGGVTLDGKKIVLNGAEWDDLREKLADKVKTLPPTHPLRRLKAA